MPACTGSSNGGGLIEAYCEDGVIYSDGTVAPLAAEPSYSDWP